MNPTDVEELLVQYRAGLEAELSLLRQLSTLADRQKVSTEARNFERLTADSDERDRVTRNLVALEDALADVRQRLTTVKTQAASHRGYAAILTLRQQAADLVARVLSVDRESLRALADAEMARRAAMASLERGEATLAAYRKVLTPPVEHAAIVDRRG